MSSAFRTCANMKQLVLIAMAMVGLPLCALGQSQIIIDNQLAVGSVAIDSVGNYYTGTYGLEIWAKTGAIGDNINSFNGQPGGAITAYANLAMDGYMLGGTFANKNMTTPGAIVAVGTAYCANVNSGYNAVAVVAWNSSAPSFSAAVDGGAKAGVYTFINGFFIPLNVPTTLADNWGSTDLVMTTVPEPTTFAVVGLAAAAFLIMSRRK
jgi:PEP-CTERM motif